MRRKVSKRRMTKTVVLFVISILLTACSKKEVEVRQAWIRAAPPSANVMAAYMDLYNGSGSMVVLTGVESEDFNRAEIHETRIENGQSQMIHHAHVEIEDGALLQFKPNSWHVMLVGPKMAKKNSGEVTIKLLFADDNYKYIKVPIKTQNPN